MTSNDNRADVTRGVIVLRCLADFLAARRGLPDVIGVQITWSHADRVWGVLAQLAVDAGLSEVERWALALDDAVITSQEVDGAHGPYMSHEATGTVHGHPVRVWTHVRHKEAR
ncbi:hypothetical protein GCM10023205_83630 [Yinghuangia aomiensis]|uniref:Uncharacterized protein n=1 Tax=Yinghuangia aomiensis TaxID=676205 RepID=A0ABP9IGQ2_9ACTN